MIVTITTDSPNVAFGNVPGQISVTVTLNNGNGTGQGLKGDAFVYEDFTPEQLALLKGVKGDAFVYSDFTPEQLALLKGTKGDAFVYSDFTPEQLALLKGAKGDAFVYADFTPEQLALLKGATGSSGVGIIAKDTTPSAVLTGTTNTILKSYAVTGSTLSTSEIIELVSCKIHKTGTNGTTNIRVYVNTTNSLTGAVNIGFYFLTNTLLYGKFKRSFPINAGNLSYPTPGNITGSDDAATSTVAANNTTPYNVANTYYIIIAGQLGSALDSAYINEVKIIF